jgi:chromosome segregation ATPase
MVDGVYTVTNIGKTEELKEFFEEVVENNYEKYIAIAKNGQKFMYDDKLKTAKPVSADVEFIQNPHYRKIEVPDVEELIEQAKSETPEEVAAEPATDTFDKPEIQPAQEIVQEPEVTKETAKPFDESAEQISLWSEEPTEVKEEVIEKPAAETASAETADTTEVTTEYDETSEVQSLHYENERLELQAADYKAQISMLKDAMSVKEEELNFVQAEKSDLEDGNKKLRAQLDAAIADNNVLREQIESLTAECKEFKEKYESLKASIEDVEPIPEQISPAYSLEDHINEILRRGYEITISKR